MLNMPKISSRKHHRCSPLKKYGRGDAAGTHRDIVLSEKSPEMITCMRGD